MTPITSMPPGGGSALPVKPVAYEDILQFWPLAEAPRQNQELALRAFAQHGSLSIEMPTGEGKTAVAMTILAYCSARLGRRCFYLVPNKVVLDQAHRAFPWLKPALGRNEHPCLFYADKPRADEVPCAVLRQCPHRVDQATGKTKEEGAAPCPYLAQKHEALHGGGIVVCTVAFYLFTHLRRSDRGEGEVVCVDEVHRISAIFRNALSTEISSTHLERAIALLEGIGATDEAKSLNNFRKKVVRAVLRRQKKDSSEVLLDDDEIGALIEILEEINEHELHKKLVQAAESSGFESVESRETLRRLEILTRDLRRYISALRYAVPGPGRRELNYIYGTVRRADGGDDSNRPVHLVIKCHHVAPLVKRVMPDRTVGLSATIGDQDVFRIESGLDLPIVSFLSMFSAANTRIYMPTDTRNLSFSARSKGDPAKETRRMVRAAKRFADGGIRSLIVVVSEEERLRTVRFAAEEGLSAVSYTPGDPGNTARSAAERFASGEGSCLVGTSANYAEGVDLPRQLAPVIFFLRPGWPPPTSPAAQFEERRFGGRRWAIWSYRVTQQALQVRGRNIRGPEDIGVTFFVSQQFRKFLFGGLPKAMQDSYRGNMDWAGCVEDAAALLA